MTTPVASRSAGQWFDSPLGRYLLAREQAYFDRAVADVFGYNAFQLGLAAHDLLQASRIPLRVRVGSEGPVGLRADFRELPVASNSADLVLLPHTLEFSDHPHQILREVARVLLPEGHVVVACFNPRSMWGIWRALHSNGGYPWCGRFINLPRLKDWLALLGFEIVGGEMRCYVPPCSQQKWLDRLRFLDAAGDRWWPMGGGVYFLQAVKRVRGMRLIMPVWKNRLAPKKSLAAVPKKMGDQQEPAAAARSLWGDGPRDNVIVLDARMARRYRRGHGLHPLEPQ